MSRTAEYIIFLKSELVKYCKPDPHDCQSEVIGFCSTCESYLHTYDTIWEIIRDKEEELPGLYHLQIKHRTSCLCKDTNRPLETPLDDMIVAIAMAAHKK